jgi:hypothetical protein
MVQRKTYVMSTRGKQRATRLSVACGDAAAMLAGAAAIAIGMPLVAAVFGAASAANWYVSNRYADLAADPPRNDYAHLTIPIALSVRVKDYGALIREEALKNAAEDFASIVLSMSAELEGLCITIERLMGAEVAFYEWPTTSTFATVNSQRRTARQHIEHLLEAIQLQRHPLTFLSDAVPAFLEACDRSARPSSSEISTLVKESDKLLATVSLRAGVPRIKPPSNMKSQLRGKYSTATWKKALGEPLDRAYQAWQDELTLMSSALADWPDSYFENYRAQWQ